MSNEHRVKILKYRTNSHFPKKMCCLQSTEPFTSNLPNTSCSLGGRIKVGLQSNYKQTTPEITWDWTDSTSSKESPRVQFNSSTRFDKPLKEFSHLPQLVRLNQIWLIFSSWYALDGSVHSNRTQVGNKTTTPRPFGCGFGSVSKELWSGLFNWWAH